MRLDRITIALASVAGLLLMASPVLADNPQGPWTKEQSAEFCKQNPQKCQAGREKREAFCQENPAKCEQMKQKRAERQEFCKQNPQKCEEQRARMKEKRAEFQAKCAEDPAKCEQMKQERRERFQKRHGGAKPPATTPPSEAVPQPPE